MNNLSRRIFLKALPAAPAAAREVAKEVMTPGSSGPAGRLVGSGTSGECFPSVLPGGNALQTMIWNGETGADYIRSALGTPEIMALRATGVGAEWVDDLIRVSIDREIASGVCPPDVAALRSCSPAAKRHIMARRLTAKMSKESIDEFVGRRRTLKAAISAFAPQIAGTIF